MLRPHDTVGAARSPDTQTDTYK